MRFASGAVVITDENVGPLYESRVLASLAAADVPARGLRVAPGEGSKSLETAGVLYTALLEGGIDRKAMILALGSYNFV